MRANPGRRATSRCLPVTLIMAAASLSGCKSLSEKYIALEVWKYEKLFGHLPPGFVPPGAAMPAAPMRTCGQPAACPQPACGGEVVAGPAHAGGDCNQCQGGVHGGTVMPAAPSPAGLPAGLPAGPGGSPGPTSALSPAGAVTSSRPVVISDEVVLP